jgi:hypothetical protein
VTTAAVSGVGSHYEETCDGPADRADGGPSTSIHQWLIEDVIDGLQRRGGAGKHRGLDKVVSRGSAACDYPGVGLRSTTRLHHAAVAGGADGRIDSVPSWSLREQRPFGASTRRTCPGP